MPEKYDWKNSYDLSVKIYSYLEEHADDDLLNSGEESALSRSYMHILYYSCYHMILENNIKYDVVSNKRGYNSHKNTLDNINNYPVKSKTYLSDLAADMHQLKSLRVKADYKDAKFNFTTLKINDILKSGKSIFDRLDDLLNIDDKYINKK